MFLSSTEQSMTCLREPVRSGPGAALCWPVPDRMGATMGKSESRKREPRRELNDWRHPVTVERLFIEEDLLPQVRLAVPVELLGMREQGQKINAKRAVHLELCSGRSFGSR